MRDQENTKEIIVERCISYTIGVQWVEWANERNFLKGKRVVGNEIVASSIAPAEGKRVIKVAYSYNRAYKENDEE